MSNGVLVQCIIYIDLASCYYIIFLLVLCFLNLLFWEHRHLLSLYIWVPIIPYLCHFSNPKAIKANWTIAGVLDFTSVSTMFCNKIGTKRDPYASQFAHYLIIPTPSKKFCVRKGDIGTLRHIKPYLFEFRGTLVKILFVFLV